MPSLYREARTKCTMSTLLERHIVELLEEQNEKAISLLYEHYGDTLYGVAYKVVKDEELAQDVLQESFVKIWKKGLDFCLELISVGDRGGNFTIVQHVEFYCFFCIYIGPT